MSYKMLCTDMDGTLLDDNKNISERNKRAIAEAVKRGIKIVVCTGRLFTSADYYADLIGVKAPVIASNGSYIREKDRNEVIYKCALGYERSKKVLDIVKKYGIYPHFNSSDRVFTEKIIYSSEVYIKNNKTLPKDRQINIEIVEDWDNVLKKYDDEILKLIAIDKDAEKIAKAKAELKEMEDIEVVSSYFDNFEVMGKGVSKGRAVEIMSGYYNIPREEIICIGDNENDLTMIEYAGLGVAMGNGEDDVKKAADFITDTNNNDGVAKVIEKFLLNW